MQCWQGTWSLLEYEEKRFKRDENPKKRKERRFTLVSGGCEVIKVAKDVFKKYGDLETMNTLKQFTRTFPKDSELCHAYLKESDWRTYREELVDNVVVRHIVHQETAKGSARAHGVRSSPVPSPLCTLAPSQTSVNAGSQWEYYPRTGWAAGQVVRPAVEGKIEIQEKHSSAFSVKIWKALIIQITKTRTWFEIWTRLFESWLALILD